MLHDTQQSLLCAS